MQQDLQENIAYLNGTYLPESEAMVPALDRGFLFADAVYELVPMYAGQGLGMDLHVKRFENSLRALDIAEPEALAARLPVICEELAKRHPADDVAVYVQVTRGVAPRDHVPPAGIKPTVFARASAMTRTPAAPVQAIFAPDIRWGRCDIKSTALLANVLARMQAAGAGAYEAILHRDGLVTEGAASNVFAVIGSVVHTPPNSHALLPGVTRALLIAQMRRTGIPVEESPLTVAALRAADEIWVTSSSKGPVPVVQLDGEPVSSGEPGGVWQEVSKHYFSNLPSPKAPSD